MEAQSTAGGGVGFASLLTIVFIVLKLTNVIQWSWMWVLSPRWISFILFLLGIILLFILAIASDRWG